MSLENEPMFASVEELEEESEGRIRPVKVKTITYTGKNKEGIEEKKSAEVGLYRVGIRQWIIKYGPNPNDRWYFSSFKMCMNALIQASFMSRVEKLELEEVKKCVLAALSSAGIDYAGIEDIFQEYDEKVEKLKLQLTTEKAENNVLRKKLEMPEKGTSKRGRKKKTEN